MDDAERLKQLEELMAQPEIEKGFGSKQACLAWCRKVAPLLNFNEQYHQPFLYYLQIITANVSSYTAEPAFNNMLNYAHMAVGELKQKAAAAAKVGAVEEKAEGKPVLKLEPNFHGIGIDLRALFKKLKGKKPEP